MRESFPYESNVFLIRQFLVPDPLNEDCWEDLVKKWRAHGAAVSLLEWVVNSGVLSEKALIRILEGATGKRVIDELLPLVEKEHDAASTVLENNGFLVGKDPENRKLAAGGAQLPPKLSEYLGSDHTAWEWVILNPKRGQLHGECKGSEYSEQENGFQSTLGNRLTLLLVEASANKASDIYFERYDQLLQIRSKGVSGMETLETWREPECSEGLRILKRWANLSTAEASLPQDGRLDLENRKTPMSFRVSHIQAVNGESVVLRLIGKESKLPEPQALGMPSKLVKTLRESLLHEHGVILCSGSTGSGKTTTICSVISSLQKYPLKILTIEDPIEYDLCNATQSAVDPAKNWTFSAALKAFLRQDPDILLVGEIRDEESAGIACRAGLTGHSVISSLHANVPVSALDRLREWGLAPGLVAESVRLILHQELVETSEEQRKTARFSWINAGPDQLYDYMQGGAVPSGWVQSDDDHQEEVRTLSANA